jgi:hypothetical protein
MPISAIRIPFDTITEKQKERFWEKVQKGGDNECWPWIGCIKGKGYGNLRMNKVYLGTSRVGWMIVHGVDPYPLHVLHTCDNRRCCNPTHWFLGTNNDNIQDMSRKFRNSKKLNPTIVQNIRRDFSVLSRNAIARKYGLSYSTTSSIRDRIIWKYVPDS